MYANWLPRSGVSFRQNGNQWFKVIERGWPWRAFLTNSPTVLISADGHITPSATSLGTIEVSPLAFLGDLFVAVTILGWVVLLTEHFVQYVRRK